MVRVVLEKGGSCSLWDTIRGLKAGMGWGGTATGGRWGMGGARWWSSFLEEDEDPLGLMFFTVLWSCFTSAASLTPLVLWP